MTRISKEKAIFSEKGATYLYSYCSTLNLRIFLIHQSLSDPLIFDKMIKKDDDAILFIIYRGLLKIDRDY